MGGWPCTQHPSRRVPDSARFIPPPPRVHWAALLAAVACAEALVITLCTEIFPRFPHQSGRGCVAHLSLPLDTQDRSEVDFTLLGPRLLCHRFLILLDPVDRGDLRSKRRTAGPLQPPRTDRPSPQLVLTLLFSFAYFQYHLRSIAQQGEQQEKRKQKKWSKTQSAS